MASNQNGWMQNFSVKDLYQFCAQRVSVILPKITSRLTKDGGSSKIGMQQALQGLKNNPNRSYLQLVLGIFGASVLFWSTPLIYSYIWRQFRSSRYFEKKLSEFETMGIIITGCDSGVGMETAAFLSQLYPDSLIFAGCNSHDGVTKLSQLQRNNLVLIRVDITRDSDIASFVKTVRGRLYDRKIYAVINNAGFYDGSFSEVTPMDVYAKVMETNFLGAVQIVKAFLPFMMRGDPNQMNGGRIIHISSVAATLPSPGNTAFCASNAAFASFTHGIRQELREIGISVILVVPGPLRTSSLQKIPMVANTLLSSGPREVIQRFGGQHFIHSYSHFFRGLYESADPPSKIAQTIQKIISAKYPKDVYYEESILCQILSICPHYVQDYLMDPPSFRKQIMERYPFNG